MKLGDVRVLWDAKAALGEGTCWSARERAIYWVDILGQQLHRCSAAGGERRSWQFDETVSAVVERRDAGGLMVALRRGLARFDPAGGALERGAEPEPERHGNRFNDGKCDTRGRFWGGSMDFACEAPTGAIYRFDPDGSVTRAFDAGYAVTNGPTWSRDGTTMFVNDTVQRRVMAFDFDAVAGRLSSPRPWLRFSEADGHPDGMTTDAEGRIWIAHWGGSCVTAHDPLSAAELARVRLPASQVTNIAFGGDSLRTLFISSARQGAEHEPLAGALFAVDSDVTGLPANLYGQV